MEKVACAVQEDVSQRSLSGQRKNMLHFSKSLFSLLFVGILLTSSAGDLEQILQAGKLRVAVTDTATPPFMILNEQKEYVGFELDLVKSCAETMGVKLELVPVDSYDGLVTALTEDKADIALSYLSRIPQRILQVDFSQPYVKLHLSLLINKSEILKMQRRETLDNYLRHYDGPLVLQNFTCRIEQVKVLFPNAQLIFVEDRSEVEKMMKERKLVAYFDDQVAIRSLMQGEAGSRLFYQRVILEDTTDNFCIAIQPRCPRLQFFLNCFLEERLNQINSILKPVL